MSGTRTHFRVNEIIDLLGVSERTVRRWITDGTLSSVKIGGTRLVPQRELDRLLGAEEFDEEMEDKSSV